MDPLLEGIAQHPARDALTRELHARPFEALAAPAEIFLFSKLTEEGGDEQEFGQMRSFCERNDVASLL